MFFFVKNTPYKTDSKSTYSRHVRQGYFRWLYLSSTLFIRFIVNAIFFKLSIASNFVGCGSVKVTSVHQDVAYDGVKLISAP